MFLNWGFGLVGQWQIMHVGDYKRIAVIFVKATDFQLVFNFEQTRTQYSYHVWRAWYNGSCTMIAKPIRALE